MSIEIPNTIKAVVTGENKTASVKSIHFGTLDKVQNLPPDHVLVRVRAVGLNPTDWKHAFADWGGPGFVSGCDSAGDIVKVGRNVKHFKVGDRIAGFTYGTSQPDNGSYAEFVRLDSAVIFKLPQHMSYEEGASFPIPHFTAAQALYMRLNLPKPGSNPSSKKPEIILIWGGPTAAGHHALQLARLSGLRVFVTASPGAHALLKEMGVEACFDYKDPDVVQKLKVAAGDEGIAYGFDTVSEHGSTDDLVDAIRPAGGKVITLLPVSDETTNRRSNVEVAFTIAYAMLGYEFTFAHLTHHEAAPEDREQISVYLTKEVPSVLEGWKQGVGSPKFRPQKLRSIPGGLEGVIDGMRIMQRGEYGREKIVVPIA